MELNKKIIYGIDLALIVGTVIVMFFALGYTSPLVIAPINDLNTLNNSVLFEFEKGNAILIDDNIEFKSPDKIYAEDNLIVNLKPGKYYWKIIGAMQSEVRTLTINSSVDLKFEEKGSKVNVINSGSEILNVDVYDNETLVDSFVLENEQSKNINGSKVIGGKLND